MTREQARVAAWKARLELRLIERRERRREQAAERRRIAKRAALGILSVDEVRQIGRPGVCTGPL